MQLSVETREPASDPQILAAESETGVRFPEAFRTWLQQTNGCLVEDLTPVPGRPTDTFSEIYKVQEIVAINQSAGADLVPDDHLRVSLGHGGSLTIKVAGEEQGSVWWASSSLAEAEGIWEGPSQKIMIRLAEDWDSFLALDFPEDDS